MTLSESSTGFSKVTKPGQPSKRDNYISSGGIDITPDPLLFGLPVGATALSINDLERRVLLTQRHHGTELPATCRYAIISDTTPDLSYSASHAVISIPSVV